LLSASKVLIRICRASMYGDLFNNNTYSMETSNQSAAAAIASIDEQPKNLNLNLNLYSIQSKLTCGNNNNNSDILVSVQRCTVQIVSGLCEVLYFMEEKCYEFIMDKQKNNKKNQLKPSSYLSSRSSYKGNQVPYYCYAKLKTLQDTLNDDYVTSEPCWAISLVIINHYLKREVDTLRRQQQQGYGPMSRGDDHSGGGSATSTALPVTTQLDVSFDLLTFLKDIRLEDMVLLEYLRTHPDLLQLQSSSSSSASPSSSSTAPSSSLSTSSSSSTESLTTMSLQKLANMNYLTTGGESNASTSSSASKSNSMAAIASTPNMIAVVKHLALIKNNYVEANNWRGTSDNDSSSNAHIVEELVGRKMGLLANYATFLLQSIDRINSDRQRS